MWYKYGEYKVYFKTSTCICVDTTGVGSIETKTVLIVIPIWDLVDLLLFG